MLTYNLRFVNFYRRILLSADSKHPYRIKNGTDAFSYVLISRGRLADIHIQAKVHT